jgi:DNA-binding LytR/AlgR family response regulator
VRAAADPRRALDNAVEQLRGLLVSDTGASPQQSRLSVIPARIGATVSMVPVESVLFFASADKYVRVVTAEREHLIRLSLRELVPQLDPAVFWQIHRGTVVQARYIESATQLETGILTLRMRGHSEELTVSRMFAHRFRGL